MMNFCTLFDSYYIVKGLALYDSLCKTCGDDFTLYISAGDKDSYRKLLSLNLKHAVVESFEDDIETPELLSVKPTRTKAEYCWTYGPTVIYHFIQKYSLPDITYLDADLFFLSNPKIVYDEIGDNSIAITEHFFDKPSVEGKYCVQFMFFRNDEEGMAALTWWRDRCIEWCYCRFEDGKFGDQKYIEKFPILFKKVCEVKNRGVGIAPWNMNNYFYYDNELMYKNNVYPFVFFHFHGVSTKLENECLTLKIEDTPIKANRLVELFFEPYLKALRDVYTVYLNKQILGIRVHLLSKSREIIQVIRAILKKNKIATFLYFKVIGFKYSGRESKKI